MTRSVLVFENVILFWRERRKQRMSCTTETSRFLGMQGVVTETVTQTEGGPTGGSLVLSRTWG